MKFKGFKKLFKILSLLADLHRLIFTDGFSPKWGHGVGLLSDRHDTRTDITRAVFEPNKTAHFVGNLKRVANEKDAYYSPSNSWHISEKTEKSLGPRKK